MAPKGVIVDCRTSLLRGTIRQYAGPQFCRYARRWRRISDIVSVRHDKGAYTVSLDGGREYIRLKPKDAGVSASVQSAVVSVSDNISGFGPRLNPAVAPDIVAWSIEMSHGVKRLPEGLVFNGVSEVPVGMFFRRWIENMGEDCNIDLANRSVVTDLRKAKSYAASAGIDIDLDPEAMLVTDASAGYRKHVKQDGPGNWVAARAAESSTSSSSAIGVQAINTCAVQIGRTCLQFDLSNWGPPAEAYLWLYNTSSPYNKIRMHAVETFLDPLSTAGNYSRAIAGSLVGTDFTNETGNWIRSDDIISTLGGCPACLNLGLRSIHDTAADPGAVMDAYTFGATSYLEAIFNRRQRTLMGVGL